MTRTSRLTGAALVAVAALLGSVVTAQPALAASPTVAVTAPTEGAALVGTVALSADVTSDVGDAIVSVDFVLDPLGAATLMAHSLTCAGVDTSCTATGSFDTTGLTGSHSVVARVVTASIDPSYVESAPISVTISTPAPIVSITSPASGSTVSGLVTVSATGSTDAALSEFPSSLALAVDGSPAGSTSCTPAEHGCTRSLTYDATGVSGSHTFVVTVTTTRGRTATDSVTVTISNPAPTISFTAPGQGSTVVGPTDVSVTASTGATLTDYPASIAVVLDLGLPGQRSLGTIPCPGASVRTCSGTVAWDATGATGSHTLDATVTTTRNVHADAATRTVTASSPLPTVSITSPTAGTTVSGTVVVTADATTNAGLTELASSVALLVDDVQVDNQPCPLPLSHSCSITLSWDATGVTGDHVLKTVVTSTLSRTAESATVTVPVTTPPFVVAVTSPAALSVMAGTGATTTSSGIVSVGLTGATDVSQNEFPTSLALLVDGVPVGSAACPGSPTRTCTVVVLWDATKVAGPHRLSALLTTSRAREGSSPSVIVYARSGSKTALTRFTPTVYGGTASVRGQVISTTSGLPLVNLYVKVVLTPAIGTVRTVVVKTDINGRFLVRARVYNNTTVTASVGRTWLVPSRAVAVAGVTAPMSCSTSASAYFSGALGRGSCSVRYLPVGTVVRLRYYFAGRWSTLASGRTTSTVIPFTFRLRTRGTYYLQVTVGANRVYVATGSRLMRVVIR